MLDTAEKSYYIDSLAQVKGDQKSSTTYAMMSWVETKIFLCPMCESNEVLTNRLNTYFSDKISKI